MGQKVHSMQNTSKHICIRKHNPLKKRRNKKLGDLGVVPLDAGRKMTKIGGSGASVAPTATPFSPRDIFLTFGLSSTTPAHKNQASMVPSGARNLPAGTRNLPAKVVAATAARTPLPHAPGARMTVVTLTPSNEKDLGQL